MAIIERPKYLEKLLGYMGNGRVKIVTGARRSGKSFLLSTLFRSECLARGIKEDHFIYLSFEGNENSSLRNPLELEKNIRERLIDEDKYILIIDEIQNVYSIRNPILTGGKIVLAKKNEEGTLSYIGAVISLMKIDNLDIYISGSNSRFLSSDIITDFRDRGDEIRIYPLSFSEFSSKRGESKEELYEEYALYGGMPLVSQMKNKEDKEDYLKSLYELTYSKDVKERNGLSDSHNLDLLARVLASSLGSYINPKKISDTFLSNLGVKIAYETVSDYLKYYEEAFLLKKVNRFDLRGRKKIGALYKYYFLDLGIRNALLDFLSFDNGNVMENIIYNELVYRGYSVEIGILDSYKNNNGKTERVTYETDFVAKKGSRIYYLQSCYDLSSEETYEREIRPFLALNDSFKKIIVTGKNGPIRHNEQGITIMGILDFMSKEDSLEL